MKRAFAYLAAAAVLIGAAPQKSKPAPPRPAPPKISKWQQHVMQVMRDAAPGDEYFGRLKLSYLGINNTFHDEAIRAGAYTTDPRIITRVSFADEALQDWARKYPHDPQLARSYFLGFQMFRKIWTKPYQDEALSYANLIVKKFPGSFFAKTMRSSMKIGFTEHFFATPVPCGVPGVAPVPTPIATDTPTPAPGQPKMEVLPVPCLTPTPSPTPMPTVTPTPRGMTPTPSPSPSPSAGASVTPSSSAMPSPTPTPSPKPTPH